MARFEPFWEVACDYIDYIFTGLMFFVFLFILAVISLLLAPRGTKAFPIAVANFVMTATVGSVVAWIYWTCARRESDQY